MSLLTDVYHAALCAELISLEARWEALIGHTMNVQAQVEARVTLKQIEAIKKAIDANAESKS